jgi:hypothetical protein
MSSPRQLTALWELPPALFDGACVAALHGGGYRAAVQPAAVATAATTQQRCACAAGMARRQLGA